MVTPQVEVATPEVGIVTRQVEVVTREVGMPTRPVDVATWEVGLATQQVGIATRRIDVAGNKKGVQSTPFLRSGWSERLQLALGVGAGALDPRRELAALGEHFGGLAEEAQGA